MGPQGSRAPFFTCRSLIITVSLISLILIATVAIFRSYLLDPLLTCAISSCSNYNRQCPPQPDPPGVTSSVFFEDPILISLDPKDDDAWATKTSTPGGGYLWAAHNSSLDLTYGINMFHSLHCLQILRAMLQQLDQPQGHEARSSEHHHHTVMGGVHTGHCVGYIAQSLLCAADSTIELPLLEHDAIGNILSFNVDGDGVTHKCRDSSLLWEAAAGSEDFSIKGLQWEPGMTVEAVLGARG